MRNVTLLLLLLSLPQLTSAGNPLECVDPLYRASILSVCGLTNYSDQLPINFSQPDLPDEFELIGSSVFPHRTNVAYFSRLDLSEIQQVLNASLVSNEWALFENQDTAIFSSGFVTHNRSTSSFPQHYCRGQEIMSVTYRGYEDEVNSGFLILLRLSENNMGSCNSITPHRNFDRPDLPRIFLPPDVHQGGNTGYSSNGESRAEAEFRSSYTLNALVSDFSTQLLNLGWQQEGEWTGISSGGSGWVSKDDTKALLISIVKMKDSKYKALMIQNPR